MSDRFEPAPGERVVFASARGGSVGRGGCFWLVAIVLGFHVLGSLFTLVTLGVSSTSRAEAGLGVWLTPIGTFVVIGVIVALWIQHARTPMFFVTDQRIVARRFLRKPIEIDPAQVRSATRVVVKYTRYGRVVGEHMTHLVAVLYKGGGGQRVGPVKDADELVALLAAMGEGMVDARALPGTNGEPARAEERDDVFFAQAAKAGGNPCGPVFVGPTTVVGLASRLYAPAIYTVLTIAGREQGAAAVEEAMIELANRQTYGRAVVMARDGASLRVEGKNLVLSSDAGSVSFELEEADAERARRYTRTGHAYRS
ncbi:MAG TPA: hypothetical protein VGM56_21850 [Byssovorax sp.]